MAKKPKTKPEPLKDLQARAKTGDADAMADLGGRYYCGDGVEKDYVEANRLWGTAAKEGHAKAMFGLGCLYQLGRGVKKDHVKAFEWWMMAANKDDTDGMFFVGLSYYYGLSVKENPAEEHKWVKETAKKGHADGMYWLSGMYLDGRGCTKNRTVAAQWLAKAYRSDQDALFWCGPIVAAEGEWRDTSARHANEIMEAVGPLEDLFDAVKKLLYGEFHPDPDELNTVAHFTKTDVARTMLPLPKPSVSHQPDTADAATEEKHNKLRLYNVIYTNDPQEGRALIKYAQEAPKSNTDAANFARFFNPKDGCDKCPPEDTHYHTSIYCVSFTQEADHLPLWRAYGNDGDGICIEVPASLFAGKSSAFQQQFSAIRRKTCAALAEQATDTAAAAEHPSDTKALPADKPDHLQLSNMALWKVKYGGVDSNGDHPFDKVIEALGPALDKLQKLCAPDRMKHVADPVRESVQMILAPILYLCKDKAYREEQEYRVLIPSSADQEWIKLDDVDRDTGTKHAYIETEPFLFEQDGYKILIGPRVPDRLAVDLELRVRLARLGFKDNVTIEHSKIDYR